jgi:hypothetical protein
MKFSKLASILLASSTLSFSMDSDNKKDVQQNIINQSRRNKNVNVSFSHLQEFDDFAAKNSLTFVSCAVGAIDYFEKLGTDQIQLLLNEFKSSKGTKKGIAIPQNSHAKLQTISTENGFKIGVVLEAALSNFIKQDQNTAMKHIDNKNPQYRHCGKRKCSQDENKSAEKSKKKPRLVSGPFLQNSNNLNAQFMQQPVQQFQQPIP